MPTAGGPLQFIGTVSTPVIDTTNPPTGYQAVMYVTSFCQAVNSANVTKAYWYLHEVDLATGLDVCAGGSYNSSNVCVGGTPQRVNIQPTAACSSSAPACSGGSMPFTAYGQNQRPAPLEVQNSNLTPNHLIYVAFGAFQNSIEQPTGLYHGWLLSYTTDSYGNLSQPTVQGSPLQFNTSTKGAGSVAGGDLNTDLPSCDAHKETSPNGSTFSLSPNHCGSHGTFWSSTRGPAAASYGAVTANAFDIFLATGDGPFQYSDSSGNVLANGQNWGQSTLRFQWSSQTGMGLTPYQSFTPYGQAQFAWNASNDALQQNCGPISAYSPPGYTPSGYSPCVPAIQPPQVDSSCPSNCPSGAAWCPCNYTFEVDDSNDWDMGTSGEILFQAPSGTGPWWVLTTDKAGYGYLHNPADLCNASGGASGCTGTYAAGGANATYSFAQGDPGNLFPFAAAHYLCAYPPLNALGGSQPQDCDRTTSLAFYNNLLYFWPNDQNGNAQNGERLTALQFSNWTFQTAFTGTFESWAQNVGVFGDGSNDGQTHVTGSGTSFTTQVIPGDQFVACGCQPPSCPVITNVADDTDLTLSQSPGCSLGSGPWWSPAAGRPRTTRSCSR